MRYRCLQFVSPQPEANKQRNTNWFANSYPLKCAKIWSTNIHETEDFGEIILKNIKLSAKATKVDMFQYLRLNQEILTWQVLKANSQYSLKLTGLRNSFVRSCQNRSGPASSKRFLLVPGHLFQRRGYRTESQKIPLPKWQLSRYSGIM